MQVYRVLNVRVVLVDAITWTNGDRITVVSDSSVLLRNFQAYRPQITATHDSTMLITYVCVCLRVVLRRSLCESTSLAPDTVNIHKQFCVIVSLTAA